MNDDIISELEKARQHYQDTNDQGRKIAYQKAINFLKTLDKPLEDIDELDDLPNICETIKN